MIIIALSTAAGYIIASVVIESVKWLFRGGYD